MPLVTIQITREGTEPGADSATAEQKAALIHGVSKLLLDVLDKPMDSTFVIIDEVETENWGRGGLPVEQFRTKQRSRHTA
jgi:4-oxalocrotonate tautomerase